MGIRQLTLLAAYLLTDGGISAKNENIWTIYFRNNDKEIIRSFQKQLHLCCGKKGYITKRKDGSDFVRLHSKELANKLFKLSQSYRTKACENFPRCRHLSGKMSACKLFGTTTIDGIEYPKAKIPDIVFTTPELAKKFMKIYASCDGGVSVVPAINKRKSMFLVRKVFISVKHPILNKQLTELLQKMGYLPSQYKDQIRLVKKADIIKFNKEIGFIKGCRISNDSRFLARFEKNVILKKVVKSYNNPKNLLDFLQKSRSSSQLIRD
jgi:hypothetical protein